ncbi:MAG: SRPBCC domain-containing protein [Bacteroidota bacterium]
MDARTHTSTLLVEIEAPLELVWDCLTKEISKWWRTDFYTSEKTQKFILEPRLGGMMYEDFGNGGGLVWANVIGLDPPHYLELKGHLSASFGGPAVSFLHIRLENKGAKKTFFHFSDSIIGPISEEGRDNTLEGWRLLWAEGLKPYVEKKQAAVKAE